MYPKLIQLLRGVYSGKRTIRKRLAQEIDLRRYNQRRVVPELWKGELGVTYTLTLL
jgi:hypothetical protein